jgi:hypothetical protein
MASSIREQVLGAARAQLGELATHALESALDTLETQIVQARARSAGAITSASRQLERTREVLERDRALASAAVSLPVARTLEVPTPTAPPAPDLMPADCDEPIRTRAMAKLLASQGHPVRALCIYRYLLAHNAGDRALEAEIAELEARPTP